MRPSIAQRSAGSMAMPAPQPLPALDPSGLFAGDGTNNHQGTLEEHLALLAGGEPDGNAHDMLGSLRSLEGLLATTSSDAAPAQPGRPAAADDSDAAAAALGLSLKRGAADAADAALRPVKRANTSPGPSAHHAFAPVITSRYSEHVVSAHQLVSSEYLPSAAAAALPAPPSDGSTDGAFELHTPRSDAGAPAAAPVAVPHAAAASLAAGGARKLAAELFCPIRSLSGTARRLLAACGHLAGPPPRLAPAVFAAMQLLCQQTEDEVVSMEAQFQNAMVDGTEEWSVEDAECLALARMRNSLLGWVVAAGNL